MSLLQSRRDRGFRTSRGVAVAAIVLAHVGFVGLAFVMKGPLKDAEAEVAPIEVMLLAESRPAAAPQVKVKLEDVALPAPVMPMLQIDVPPESAAITMASVPTPPPPAPVSTGDEGPVAVSNVDYIRKPSGVYPPAAKRARAQGTVLVRALVDVDGQPRDVQVARTSGFALLDKAACEAVLGALFKPHRRNNVARQMLVLVPIDFFLKEGAPRRHRDRGDRSELDVRGEHHHAMSGHPEELGRLGTAALHVGE
jgi:protein TonB